MMPTSISFFDLWVWFCLGVFVGAGWAFGSLLMTRLFQLIFR